jgi:hypothetical protein
LSDKNPSNAIEEMIAYYKSAVTEHIIQTIKDEVADCTCDMYHSYETPGRPLHELYDYNLSTTNVTLLALYVQNTSLLLLFP